MLVQPQGQGVGVNAAVERSHPLRSNGPVVACIASWLFKEGGRGGGCSLPYSSKIDLLETQMTDGAGHSSLQQHFDGATPIRVG